VTICLLRLCHINPLHRPWFYHGLLIRNASALIWLCLASAPCHLFTTPVNALTDIPVVENLSYLSTEQGHPLTHDLSHIMRGDCVEGLRLLHQVDREMLRGFRFFVHQYLPKLSELLKQSPGRRVLAGSGSSGRIAIDLAAKCGVLGVIAGGDSAFIRAREGFEDSEAAGIEAMERCKLTGDDVVFLLSASGSASFNVGCAKAARKAGAKVCYFYNSRQVPEKTRQLFDLYGVMPVLVDVGPQAITGSTRLQAASLAELCLGCLLSGEDPEELLQRMDEGNRQIEQSLPEIAQIVHLGHETLSAAGCVTLVAGKNSLREVMMDTTEIPPTFSTNPPRAINELGKRAEFQAFLAGESDNLRAWKTLLGREPTTDEVQSFVIAENGLSARPLGPGNLVIGVGTQSLKAHGAKTAVISLSGQNTLLCDAEVVLDIVSDKTGLTATLLLKQILNLISNGTMILLGKVDGNQMIDVRTSNHKLIDRASRLVEDIFRRHAPERVVPDPFVRELLVHIREKTKLREEQGFYTPSPVKVAVTMIYRGVPFEEAVEFLCAHQEIIEEVFR
jgi:N-acetylmuramic acid 6-phosphate (MurNAc-6-P) etherase